MYNHLLICTDGEKEYRAICESAPEREPTVIFWPDDLGIPPGEKETLVKDLREWASSQGFRCFFLIVARMFVTNDINRGVNKTLSWPK